MSPQNTSIRGEEGNDINGCGHRLQEGAVETWEAEDVLALWRYCRKVGRHKAAFSVGPVGTTGRRNPQYRLFKTGGEVPPEAAVFQHLVMAFTQGLGLRGV